MLEIEVSSNALIVDLLKRGFLCDKYDQAIVLDRRTGETLFCMRPVAYGEGRSVLTDERAWQLSDTVDVLGKEGLSTIRGFYQIVSSPKLFL